LSYRELHDPPAFDMASVGKQIFRDGCSRFALKARAGDLRRDVVYRARLQTHLHIPPCGGDVNGGLRRFTLALAPSLIGRQAHALDHSKIISEIFCARMHFRIATPLSAPQRPEPNDRELGRRSNPAAFFRSNLCLRRRLQQPAKMADEFRQEIFSN